MRTREQQYGRCCPPYDPTRADTALRNRLATLCDERLSRRHGLTRDDSAAEALLGSELLRELDGPPRRLRREEIDGYLKRIEEL